MQEKTIRFAVLVSLAVSVFFILWITLFSRLGSDSRHFYPPFWSYKAIINGSGKALYEVLGNIILFIPIGGIAGLVLHLRLWQTVLMSFGLSLAIESCQWLFWLGSFEIDDLLHNTLGAGIGAAIINRIASQKLLTFDNRKKSLALLMLLTVVAITLGFAYQGIRWQERKRLAALNNREDGAINLLVLNGESGFVGESEVYVSYRDDGGIHVTGSSDTVGYLLIGRPTLEPGSYTLTGFSGVEPNTSGIYLEKKVDGSYLRFTPDLGPVDIVSFVLDKTEKIRAYIKTYPGAEVEFTAYPVIYKEE